MVQLNYLIIRTHPFYSFGFMQHGRTLVGVNPDIITYNEKNRFKSVDGRRLVQL